MILINIIFTALKENKMTKEEIKSKIKLIETDIELTKELILFNKKDDQISIFCSILAFMSLLLLSIEIKEQNFMYVLGVSIFTNTVYSLFDKMRMRKRNLDSKLKKLQIDLTYYKYLLDGNKDNSN